MYLSIFMYVRNIFYFACPLPGLEDMCFKDDAQRPTSGEVATCWAQGFPSSIHFILLFF